MSQRPGWLCRGRLERETLPFVAFWHGLLDAFWIEGWVNEVYSASRITDGNPHKVPWMYRPGIGHPLFSYPPFDEGNGHQPRSGPGLASLYSGYGWTYRSIESGVPLGKGPGVFWRAGGRPAWTRAPRGGGIRRVLPGESQRSGEITRHAENAGRDSWHVAPLRRWLR